MLGANGIQRITQPIAALAQRFGFRVIEDFPHGERAGWLWVFCEQSQPPRWFLHGIFA